MTGHTLLVVPLPGAASLAPPLGGSPAVPHVRLVDPFTDPEDVDEGVVAELRGFFADVVPFQVVLTDISQLPSGAAYLTLDPAAPFRHLAQGVHHLFPEVPRASTALDLVPHLAVPRDDGTSLQDLRERIGPRLPLTTLAEEAALWSWSGAGVRILGSFPFGTSAA